MQAEPALFFPLVAPRIMRRLFTLLFAGVPIEPFAEFVFSHFSATPAIANMVQIRLLVVRNIPANDP